MAFCPQCRKEMGQMDAVCPHCGYDFPTQEPEAPEPSGIAYSGLADIALIIGEIAATLGAIMALFYVVMLLLGLHILHALVAVIGFFVSLANFVVFVRIRDMGRNRTR